MTTQNGKVLPDAKGDRKESSEPSSLESQNRTKRGEDNNNHCHQQTHHSDHKNDHLQNSRSNDKKVRITTREMLGSPSDYLMKTACCSRSLESAAFWAGIYTLVSYTFLVVIGAYNINLLTNDQFLRFLCSILLILSGISVISSVLLIIGVCVECKKLFPPWIISIIVTTILDVIVCLYILIHDEFTEWIGFLLASDAFFCFLNIYLLIVVISLHSQLSESKRRSLFESHPTTAAVQEVPAPRGESFAVVVDKASSASTKSPNSPPDMTNSQNSGCSASSIGSSSPSASSTTKTTSNNHSYYMNKNKSLKIASSKVINDKRSCGGSDDDACSSGNNPSSVSSEPNNASNPLSSESSNTHHNI